MVLMNRATLLVINIATGILTARVLNPAGRGQLAALVVAPLFFSGVTTVGLPTALISTSGDGRIRRTVWSGPPDPQWIDRAAHRGRRLVGHTSLAEAATGGNHRRGTTVALATPISSIMLTGRAAWESEGRLWASSTSLLMSSALTLVVLAGLWFAHALTPMTAASACTS